MNFENIVLSNIIFNEEYSRKVIPFLKEEYFPNSTDKIIFNIIDDFIKKYNNVPSKEAILIELNNKSINEELYKNCKSSIDNLKKIDNNELNWLIDKTESFCQEKAIYNAIMQSIQIIDNKDGKNSKGSIPQILSDALAVSFDTHIGHDFLEDYNNRYDFYHKKEIKIPFDLEYFNTITGGGLPKKTLNIILAGCIHPDTKVKIRYKKRNFS